MKYKKQIFSAAIIVVAVVLFSSQINIGDIQNLVKQAGPAAPVVFILLHSLTYIFAPISGTPFWLAGYPLFGDKFIIYNYISSLIGMMANFWISRVWGRSLVIKFTGEKNMAKIDSFTKRYGIKALIFLRLFQGNFADFISYAYGLTEISFSKYLAISAIAPIPWTLLWWFIIFPRIDNYKEFLLSFVLITSPAIAISIVLALYYTRKKPT